MGLFGMTNREIKAGLQFAGIPGRLGSNLIKKDPDDFRQAKEQEFSPFNPSAGQKTGAATSKNVDIYEKQKEAADWVKFAEEYGDARSGIDAAVVGLGTTALTGNPVAGTAAYTGYKGLEKGLENAGYQYKDTYKRDITEGEPQTTENTGPETAGDFIGQLAMKFNKKAAGEEGKEEENEDIATILGEKIPTNENDEQTHKSGNSSHAALNRMRQMDILGENPYKQELAPDKEGVSSTGTSGNETGAGYDPLSTQREMDILGDNPIMQEFTSSKEEEYSPYGIEKGGAFPSPSEWSNRPNKPEVPSPEFNRSINPYFNPAVDLGEKKSIYENSNEDVPTIQDLNILDVDNRFPGLNDRNIYGDEKDNLDRSFTEEELFGTNRHLIINK